MAVSKVVKSNGDVIMDISQDNVNPNNLLQGGTAHGSDGEAVQGAVIVAPTDVTEVSDTTPYIYKTSEHDAVYDELVGGSVAWNQLAKPISSWGYANIDVSTSSNGVMTINGTASGTTYPVLNDTEYSVIGHKYLMTLHRTDLTTSITLQGAGLNMSNGTKIQNATDSGKWYIRIMSGTVCDNIKVTPQIIDLTQMFGSTIADYVYSLEQSTAGSGIAWLKSYGFFTKDYYAYNAGSLASVNTSGKKVVGKNLVEKTIAQTNVVADGTIQVPVDDRYDVHICKVKRGYHYFLTTGTSGSGAFVYAFYSENPSRGSVSYDNTRYVTSPTAITSPIDGYMAFRTPAEYTTPQCELGSTATNYEPYTSITYPIQSTDLRGLYKLSGNKLYTDGDIYSSDGTVTRKYGYRDYQSGDESLANAITDGTHTIYKLSAPTTAPAPPFTSPQIVYRSGTEEYLDTRDVPIPVGGNRKYVDIPEWMVNEYFDDVRSSASGAIEGDLVFDESSSAHGHGLISSDNKKAIVFNHDKIDITSSSGGSRGYIADGDEMATITLRQGDVEISGHKHSSQGDSHSSYLAIYPDGIEISVVSADDGIIVSGLDSGTGVNLILAPDGTIYKASSSRNVKHDIEYVKDTNSYHDALMQLKPATFIYNSDKTNTQKLGMIAEDVADVCPIAGMTDKDGKVENYDDRAIIAMLVAEVQRLNAEIDKLKGR